ncbi:MAG TPA: hypothetical protein DIW23_14325 [Anaerolineae bacterium]|nr:hypothetical protein [Anaerolineae bacterium]
MNFDYGNILTSTFQITWKHKVFWGILTIPMLFSFVIFPIAFLYVYFFEEAQTPEISALIVIIYFVLVFAITIISTILQIFALSAVTLGIVRVEKGEGSLKFIDLLQDSRAYFWRQLGVFVIIQFSVGLIFAIFLGFVFAATMVTMGLASLCLQPIMLLLTPFMFLVIGVLEAAHTAVITENLNAWDAVKRGFEIVRDHIWKYIIITVIVYFGVTLIFSFLMFPMFIPLMVFPIFSETGSEILIWVSVVFACIFFPIMAFISAISQTLLKTALDLTYIRLTHKGENQVMI